MTARLLCATLGHRLRDRLRGDGFRVCRRCGVHVWSAASPTDVQPARAGTAAAG